MKHIAKSKLSVAITLIITIMACAWIFTCQQVYAATTPVESPNISILINQQKIDTTGNVPITYNNRVLLPMRLVFESLGATVQWDNTAKVATATDGTTTIKMALNSKTAYVDDQAIILDTPALANKNRIYMPLRFVGENFGATINWDNISKSVSIIKLAPEPEPEPEPIPDPVYNINGIEIDLTYPVQLINGRAYIYIEDYMDHLAVYLPAEYFFSWNKESNGNYTFLFDGTKRELIADADYYLHNNNQVKLVDKLLTIQGKVYIPLSFSKEVLDGIITYDPSSNITNIYINRPKFKSEMLETESTTNLIPTLVENAEMSNNQLLSISDNPEVLSSETVSPVDNSILMKTDITTSSSISKHRIFGWHTNQLGKKIKIGVIVENTGSTNIIINSAKVAARTTHNTWVSYDVGLPLAEAMLSGQMSNITPTDATIPPHSSRLIQSFTLNNNQMCGFIIDLELQRSGSDSNINYQARVVLATDDETYLENISSDTVLADLYKTHPRGTWESSEMLTELPMYDTGSPEVSYSISNGITDNVYDIESSLDPADQTISNIGHFGVVYRVRIPIFNDQGAGKTVRLRLCGRGGYYACAVKTPNGVFITPVMKPQTKVADVYDYSAPAGISYVDLEIVHAGGSDLPVAVDLLTL